MDIRFLGAVEGNVTGSRTLLTFAHGLKVLVDFGLVQSNYGNFAQTLAHNGREFEFDISEIDYVVLTHGHSDHIGLLPLLVKRGFTGRILATKPTADFAMLSLPDTAKIIESDVKRANKIRPKNKLSPLFSIEEATETANSIEAYGFNQEIVLDSSTKLVLKKAGHMLGATMPTFTYIENGKEKSICFTGDNSGKTESKPFLPPADDIGGVDYIVCESTYGNRLHKKSNPLEILERSVQETCIDRGKTLLVATFSMQRSSEILWLLREAYMNNKYFHKIPIYLDTPMGVKAQRIMDENRDYWAEKWLERDEELTNIFDWNVIEYITDYQDSKALANGDPKIILSSSGMCNAGRILDHLVSFLPSKGCKVLFSGYVAEGTLGYNILNEQQKSVSVNRRQVIKRAEIEQMSFSSHADYNQLVEFLKTSDKRRLQKVFLNHGDKDAVEEFENELKRHLKNVDIVTPEYDKSYKLK